MSEQPVLKMILAMSPEGGIGSGGGLPWRLEGDLKRFQELTKGSVVVMGRNTFNSLPNGALKDRVNIVVSSRVSAEIPVEFDRGAFWVRSINKAVELATLMLAKEVWFMGGAGIYEEAFPMVDEVHVTLVHRDKEEGVGYDTYVDLTFPHADWMPAELGQSLFDIDASTGLPVPSHTYMTFFRKVPLNRTR